MVLFLKIQAPNENWDKKCDFLDKYLTRDGQEIDLSWPGLKFSTRQNSVELEQLAHTNILTIVTMWSENGCRGLSKFIGPEKGQILSIFKINRVVSNVLNSGPIPEINSILEDLENVNTSVFWLRLRCFGRFYVLVYVHRTGCSICISKQCTVICSV